MAEDKDQYQPKERVFTRRRQVSDVGPVQIPGVTLYDETGRIISADVPLAVEMRGPSASAFGEVLTVKETREISAFLRHVDDARVFNSYTSGTGTITSNGSGLGTLQCGVGLYSYASVQTVQVVSYEPGTGMQFKWTAMFPDGGLANSTQIVGAYHAEAGLAIGYNGESFGFVHRYGRRLEIQKLTITTPAGGSENATITLNGQGHTVPLTAGSVEHNAREIAEFSSGYAEAGGLVTYDVWAVTDDGGTTADVYFIRQTHGDATGTFSFSSGTAVASFTEWQAGAAGTQDWTYQSAWSIDPLDGTGPSGMTLDPSKLNVYMIVAGWLGSLPPILYVAVQGCQRMIPVHVLDWTNEKTEPWCADPRLPIGYSVASLGSTTNRTIKGASCSGSIQGELSKLGPRISRSADVSVTTTEAPKLSVLTAPVDLDHNAINRRRLNLEELVLSNTGSKDALFKVYVGDPSNLTGYEFVAAANDHSPIWADTSSTAITGLGDPVVQEPVNGGETVRVQNPDGRPFTLIRGQVLIITAETNASTTTARVTVSGYEDI